MTDACPKCGSQTPIGHRCIVDDLAAIRDADLSDHPLMHAIKGTRTMTDQTAPVMSEEDREALVREMARLSFTGHTGEDLDERDHRRPPLLDDDEDWGPYLADLWEGWARHALPAVERIVARHRQQAVREALAEVEALADGATDLDEIDEAWASATDLRAAIARAKGGDA